MEATLRARWGLTYQETRSFRDSVSGRGVLAIFEDDRADLRMSLPDDGSRIEDLRSLLRHFAQEGALAGPLANVDELLLAWQDGDIHAGAVAADALDQLEGLLLGLISTLKELSGLLPVVLQEMPPTPQ